MPKVEFTGGKIVETPTGGVAAAILSITGTLTDAKETAHSMFYIGANTSDVAVPLGNISASGIDLLVIKTEGPITVKLNGNSGYGIVVESSLVLFGTPGSFSLYMSNATSSPIKVEVYAATTTD